MNVKAITYLIVFIFFTLFFSCNKDEAKEIETSHIIINNTYIYIDSICYWYGCRGNHTSITLYDINPHDTSQDYTLINACKELEFEIFIEDTLYWGDFTWSLVVDPTDDLLKEGCYIFYIIELDGESKYAIIASRFDHGCNFTR
jgi:hypothetical protein